MKIKACEDTSSILMQIHGESLIDQIISPDCDHNFLSELENTINEISSFKQKNIIIPTNNNNNKNTKKNNSNYNRNSNNNINNNNQNQIYQFENDNVPAEIYNPETNRRSEDYPSLRKLSAASNQINQRNSNKNTHIRQHSNISGSKSDLENLILSCDQRIYSAKINNKQASRENIRRSHSKSTLNVSRNSKSRGSVGKADFFEDSVGSEAKFEQMLRHYGGRQMSGKVFMNYSRKVGDFFDPTLQKGGNSALDMKDQSRKRSGSRRRSGNNNNSVSISYSQNNNL